MVESAFGDATSAEVGDSALVDGCSVAVLWSEVVESLSIGESVLALKDLVISDDLDVVSGDCSRSSP